MRKRTFFREKIEKCSFSHPFWSKKGAKNAFLRTRVRKSWGVRKRGVRKKSMSGEAEGGCETDLVEKFCPRPYWKKSLHIFRGTFLGNRSLGEPKMQILVPRVKEKNSTPSSQIVNATSKERMENRWIVINTTNLNATPNGWLQMLSRAKKKCFSHHCSI